MVKPEAFHPLRSYLYCIDEQDVDFNYVARPSSPTFDLTVELFPCFHVVTCMGHL
jgi:hypothetical protein